MDGVPVEYKGKCVEGAGELMEQLWLGLAWERRGSTPRREYYVNPNGRAYEYGKGAGAGSTSRALRFLP